MRKTTLLLAVLAVTSAACETPIEPRSPEGLRSGPDGGIAAVQGASHGPVVATASGTLSRFVPNADGSVTTVQMDVDARKYADGTARGSYRYQAGAAAITVDVLCMTVVDGNKAWIAGTITESTVGFLGHVSFFYTFDNGEGANAEPDIVSLVRVVVAPGLDLAQPFCDDVPQGLPPRDVEDGNIKVRG